MDNVKDILILILCLGIINAIINKLSYKSVLSASLAFWLGWFFLMLGSLSFMKNDLMDSFSSLELDTFYTFFVWCFWGFLLGSLINFGSKKRVKSVHKLLLLSNYITENYFRKFLKIILVIGIVFFLLRVAEVGLTVSFFSDVRNLYIQRNFSFLQWLGTHCTVIVYFMLILLGVRDAHNELNIKFLLRAILFASPLFLANGTRTFLIAPILNYLASYLLTRSTLRKRFFSRIELYRISSLLGLSLLIFTVIGFSRGGYGDSFNFYLPIVGWPVSTAQEFSYWLNAAINSGPTNGYLTSGWFASTLQRLHLASFGNEEILVSNVISDFRDNNLSAAYVPRSIIPDLIFDFGYKRLAISSFILALFMQVGVNLLRSKSMISHTISVVFLVGAFMTIQKSIFSPGSVVLIFWSIVATYYVQIKMTAK